MLHYSDFPHIFDLIIASTARQTQLTLRLVCRVLKQAVDRHQVRSVVLTSHPTDPSAVSVLTAGGLRIPGLATIGPLSWSQLPVHPGRALTAYTRVVEVRGFFREECRLQLLRAAFPALDIVRETPGDMTGPCDAYAPKHTLHFPLSPKTVVTFSALWWGSQRGELEDEGMAVVWPPSVTKVVINAPSYLPPMQRLPPHCREVVVVSYGHPWVPGAEQRWYFEFSLVSYGLLRLDQPGVKFTFVGLACTENGTEDEFRRRLARVMSYCIETGQTKTHGIALDQARLSGQPDPDAVLKTRQLLDKAEFVSMQEYYKRVGPAVAELETVERLQETGPV